MAPRQSSKRRANGASALSLPGLAVGLLSAIAAGFFASRALRKKRAVATAVKAMASSESDASRASILSSFEGSHVIQEEDEGQEEEEEVQQMASIIINREKPWPPFAVDNAPALGEENILSIFTTGATGTSGEQMEEELSHNEEIILGSVPLLSDTTAPPACGQCAMIDQKYGRDGLSMMKQANPDPQTDIADANVSSHINKSISEKVSHSQTFTPDSAFQLSWMVSDPTAIRGLGPDPTQISKAALVKGEETSSVSPNDAVNELMSAQESLIEDVHVHNPVLGSIQFHVEALKANNNCTKMTSLVDAASDKVSETCFQGLESRSLAQSLGNSDTEDDHEQLSNASSMFDGHSESSIHEVTSAAVFPLDSCLVDDIGNWSDMKPVGTDNSVREDTLKDDGTCELLNRAHWDFDDAQAKTNGKILQDYEMKNFSVDVTMEVPDLESFSDQEDGDVPDLVESSGDEGDNVDVKGSKNTDMEEKMKPEYLNGNLNNKEGFCRTGCNVGQNGPCFSTAAVTEASSHAPCVDMFRCKRELDESQMKCDLIKAFETKKILDPQGLHALKTFEGKRDEIKLLDISDQMFHVHSKKVAFTSHIQNVPFLMLEMVIISLLIGLVAIVLFFFGHTLKQD